jgi:hypothetical protein
MPRTCGICSLCCKLPYMAELDKPIDTWCRHCRPGKGGCSIYPQRPSSCRDFECLWRIDEQFGDEWCPARSKMLLAVKPADGRVVVTVDPAFPTAWRREPYYSWFRASAKRDGPVVIRIGLRIIALAADGSETTIHRSQAQIEERAQDQLSEDVDSLKKLSKAPSLLDGI